jgi:predicted nucleic acid-binding protein
LRSILDVAERQTVIEWLSGDEIELVSSRLLKTEVIRVLRRDERPLSDANPLFDIVDLVRITEQTHIIAEAMSRHIRSLDAIHLATALRLPVTPIIATHDSQMRDVARDLGFETVDPVTRERRSG